MRGTIRLSLIIVRGADCAAGNALPGLSAWRKK
jgi:hypothetical protein